MGGRLVNLSTDILANLNPSFWGNPMEFFDKELKAARLLDDFVRLSDSEHRWLN